MHSTFKKEVKIDILKEDINILPFTRPVEIK